MMPRVWIYFSKPHFSNSRRIPIAKLEPDHTRHSWEKQLKRDKAVEYVSMAEAQEMVKNALLAKSLDG